MPQTRIRPNMPETWRFARNARQDTQIRIPANRRNCHWRNRGMLANRAAGPGRPSGARARRACPCASARRARYGSPCACRAAGSSARRARCPIHYIRSRRAAPNADHCACSSSASRSPCRRAHSGDTTSPTRTSNDRTRPGAASRSPGRLVSATRPWRVTPAAVAVWRNTAAHHHFQGQRAHGKYAGRPRFHLQP